MLIYDITSSIHIDFNSFSLGLVFICIGIFFFSGVAKHIINYFNSVNKSGFSTKNIFRVMGVFCIIAGSVLLFTQTKNYIYMHNIQLFEKTEMVLGKVDSVRCSEFLNESYITIFMDLKEYTIAKDDKYISQRNLLKDDSLQLIYFADKLDKNNIVVQIKLLH